MSHLTQMYVGDEMALPSYISRREGRYYLQIRFARPLAALTGVPLYRVSLRTSDYRKARLRLAECLGWFHRMNDSVDYVDLFQKNALSCAPISQKPSRSLRSAWFPAANMRSFSRI